MDVAQTLIRAAELHRAGHLAEAEALYREVLSESPDHPDALHLLGLTAQATGRPEDAIDLINRALALRPDFPYAHYNLGRIFHQRDQFELAEASYRRALACKPDYAEALDNLGGALQAQDRLQEALACYERALALKPDYPQALSNLGTLLQDLGRPYDAVEAYRRALALDPGYVEAHHNLGEALQDIHQMDEAISSYERALALRADYAEAHCGLAFALLRSGRLRDGWPEYEWRWRRHDYALQQRHIPGPAWDGSDPAGKTTFIYSEQGFGDTIQFARFASALADRGAKVIFECQPELIRLIRGLRGIDVVLSSGQTPPSFDWHVSAMSLPLMFGTSLDTIPSTGPYLMPPRELAESWKARLDEPRFKAGLVWAANPHHQQARSYRSTSLAALAPLARIDGVRFYSLQKGSPAAEAPDPPPGMQLVDLSADLADFADTAAAILQLDLVIAVDTAVAHLAGALGRPVWVMLPFAAEWRWLLDRSDSPWYPSMRLFRQPLWGDWKPVVEEVAGALATLCESQAC